MFAFASIFGDTRADEWDRVRLDVVEPPACIAVREVPVAVGLIFPKGQLTSARGAVVDEAGARCLAKWR
ncbi:MAG: hypothetical protein ACKODH_05060 [Limisphaerales bacterium]